MSRLRGLPTSLLARVFEYELCPLGVCVGELLSNEHAWSMLLVPWLTRLGRRVVSQETRVASAEITKLLVKAQRPTVERIVADLQKAVLLVNRTKTVDPTRSDSDADECTREALGRSAMEYYAETQSTRDPETRRLAQVLERRTTLTLDALYALSAYVSQSAPTPKPLDSSASSSRDAVNSSGGKSGGERGDPDAFRFERPVSTRRVRVSDDLFTIAATKKAVGTARPHSSSSSSAPLEPRDLVLKRYVGTCLHAIADGVSEPVFLQHVYRHAAVPLHDLVFAALVSRNRTTVATIADLLRADKPKSVGKKRSNDREEEEEEATDIAAAAEVGEEDKDVEGEEEEEEDGEEREEQNAEPEDSNGSESSPRPSKRAHATVRGYATRTTSGCATGTTPVDSTERLRKRFVPSAICNTRMLAVGGRDLYCLMVDALWHRNGDGDTRPREKLSETTVTATSQVVVRGLRGKTKRVDVEDFFASCGPVVDTWLSRPLGTAIAIFADPRDASDACRDKAGFKLCGAPVEVELISDFEAQAIKSGKREDGDLVDALWQKRLAEVQATSLNPCHVDIGRWKEWSREWGGGHNLSYYGMVAMVDEIAARRCGDSSLAEYPWPDDRAGTPIAASLIARAATATAAAAAVPADLVPAAFAEMSRAPEPHDAESKEIKVDRDHRRDPETASQQYSPSDRLTMQTDQEREIMAHLVFRHTKHVDVELLLRIWRLEPLVVAAAFACKAVRQAITIPIRTHRTSSAERAHVASGVVPSAASVAYGRSKLDDVRFFATYCNNSAGDDCANKNPGGHPRAVAILYLRHLMYRATCTSERQLARLRALLSHIDPRLDFVCRPTLTADTIGNSRNTPVDPHAKDEGGEGNDQASDSNDEDDDDDNLDNESTDIGYDTSLRLRLRLDVFEMLVDHAVEHKVLHKITQSPTRWGVTVPSTPDAMRQLANLMERHTEAFCDGAAGPSGLGVARPQSHLRIGPFFWVKVRSQAPAAAKNDYDRTLGRRRQN